MDATLPRELLLMRLGKTSTLRGSFELTREAAKACAGSSVAIQASDFDMGDRPAGYGRIEAREDGLWVTDISWSLAATELLSRKRTPAAEDPPVFLVPAFTFEGDGEVKRVIATSLTTMPADADATRVK